MTSWRRVEPTTVAKIGWRTVVTKRFTMPDGRIAEFDTVNTEDAQAAAVIALTPDNMVVVARQFRAGPEKYMDELPGGAVDAGEAPVDAARRELLEETGYVAGDMTWLGDFGRDGYMNGRWHYFIARNCRPVAQQTLDEHEFIDVRVITIKELFENAKRDGMTDHAAVLLAYDQLKQLEENK